MEALFQQLMECTDALIEACQRPVSEETEEDGIGVILEKRERLLHELGDHLAQETDPDKYVGLFEKCKQKEEMAGQLLAKAMDHLSQKIRDTRHSRSVSTNYNAYTRIMPYGAFIDQKK
ncbi:hypothetical protein G3578_10805 [Brevibacillus sp. SYP-B805]|uniref:hypothetical protein n=1 Tax=Brevibacillus sp. SYP-B805 TaxID=1578199 RepID=UPI0013ECF325|nr:hypothetical protein [Brevibacillus sp. SYP-B805]NGQ95643.1 hypothetical protein [Brevibacillus sp. SYP-B805]